METVIAEADWSFVPSSGSAATQVKIQILTPTLDKEGDWRCDAIINVNGKAVARHGLGADSVDALTNCLIIMSIDMKAYAKNEKGSFLTALGSPPSVTSSVLLP